MKVELQIIIILFLPLRRVITRQIFRLIKEFHNIVSTQIYAQSAVKEKKKKKSQIPNTLCSWLAYVYTNEKKKHDSQ